MSTFTAEALCVGAMAVLRWLDKAAQSLYRSTSKSKVQNILNQESDLDNYAWEASLQVGFSAWLSVAPLLSTCIPCSRPVLHSEPLQRHETLDGETVWRQAALQSRTARQRIGRLGKLYVSKYAALTQVRNFHSMRLPGPCFLKLHSHKLRDILNSATSH